ncbi:hypothetical protein [uncultured Caulobacter sp.]|uniref:hypothetical protein n=1 Tax=uncultured Caulobacter sp. TaxID=158749 RepID=UPI00262E5AAB|nr:hypothetical protein [uncultured Caulobacter sp.]
MGKVDFDTTRRGLLKQGGMLTAALALPDVARAASAARPNDDWAWLVGAWNVENRKLRERLTGNSDWLEFPGKSALWLTMGGLGTIDDNAFVMKDGVYRAAGIRAWDPATGTWAIWWLDGRAPTAIDPPVRGRFRGDEGVFLGADTLRGHPIDVRFHWQGIHGPRPHWQQSFSPDGGKSWEMNFENFFSRTSTTPAPVPRLPGEAAGVAPADWEFLVGRWRVRHRRLAKRLVGGQDWQTFDGTLVNRPLMAGAGNFSDNVMNFPAGTARSVGLRAYDPARALWSSWFLDGRSPRDIAPPLTGRFEGGVGTFHSAEMIDGKTVLTRVQWSGIGPNTARWEQSASADGGATWEVNWVSEFQRDHATGSEA